MWGRSPRGNNGTCSALCWISAISPTTYNQIMSFWCCLPVCGFVYVLEPCGSLQRTLLRGWEFLPLPPQPSWVFSISGLRLYFPALEPWVGWSVSLPHRYSWLSVHKCGTTASASHHLAGSTSCSLPVSCSLAHPAPQSASLLGLPAAVLLAPVLSSPTCQETSPSGCLSQPLLLVWMNVSSLTPWLSDFHTVWFSVSSGWLLFLNCCCPFGCLRRHSVSTYTSILARSW